MDRDSLAPGLVNEVMTRLETLHGLGGNLKKMVVEFQLEYPRQKA